MAEHHSPNHHEKLPMLPEAEPIKELPAGEIGAEKHEVNRQAMVETSRQEINKTALETESFVVQEKVPEPVNQVAADKDLKDLAYNRLLVKARKNLFGPDKAMSRFIHQPSVDAVSQAAEKTIARPSGILGGSIAAFVGSGLLLYLAKHYGFRYNFLIFAMLFVAGFAIGLVVEVILRIFKPAKN